MARIAVTGYMIRYPLAGMMLAYFHYLLGFLRLGHEVLYVEESGWANSCYNPQTNISGDDPTYGIDVVKTWMRRFGSPFPLFYVNRDTGTMPGSDWPDLKRMLGASDLLINLGGVCWLPEFRLCRRRALIDMDPFFTQIGHMGLKNFEEHDLHFTYGMNVGRPDCTIPSGGVNWRRTVPPVVPEIWDFARDTPIEDSAPLTTIANWTAYGGAMHNGERYGQKNEEFARLAPLPRRTSQKLEIALAGAPAEVWEQLRHQGWILRDAASISRDISDYSDYIARSRGEFSAAKHAYVKTRSGWFSDRSVCYLASGRPVITQDCGINEWLPAGSGVLTFSSLEQAAERIAEVNSNYAGHCRSARKLAEEVFSYRVVLPAILKAFPTRVELS